MGNNPEVPASREETEEQGNSEQRRSKYSKHKDDCTSNKGEDFFMMAFWKPRIVKLKGQIR